MRRARIVDCGFKRPSYSATSLRGGGSAPVQITVYLRCVLAVFAVVVTTRPAPAQISFDLAERRLAACAAHADLHPPYHGGDTVMDACQHEAEAYVSACVARTHSEHAEFECRGAAYSLATSMQKRDPIDDRFVACLKSKGQADALPLELLTLCRSERQAFEESCRQRKDAAQCENDAESIARSVCVMRDPNDDLCGAS